MQCCKVLQVTGWEQLVQTWFNSKFHLIQSYCEIFFYHFPYISCLKYTVNSNFPLILSKTLLMNDFKLTIPNLYINVNAVDTYKQKYVHYALKSLFVMSIQPMQ